MDDVVRWIAVGVGVVVVVDSARRARTRDVGDTEERIFRAFNDGPEAIRHPVWLVMQAGSFAAVWVVAAALAFAGERLDAVVVLAVGTAVWGGVKLVKPSVGRGRPAAHLDDVHVRGAPQSGLGYPSGHAAVSLTLALSVSHSAPIGILLLASVVALVTGCSRMYVGAHLPLDVEGGFGIALVVGTVTALALGA